MWLPSLMGTEVSFPTAGVIVTASGTAHTKGSWAELVATAPFDVLMLAIAGYGTATSTIDTSQLFDIGVGAAGSEKVVIANIPTGNSTLGLDNAAPAYFPVAIPSGSRISGRLQAAIAADVHDTWLFMYGGGSWTAGPLFQSVDTMGAVTAASHGTDLQSGAIIEIEASTPEDYKALGWGLDMGGDPVTSSVQMQLEVFVGAAAAEKSLFNNIYVDMSSSERVDTVIPAQGILPIELNIPAGSRLSAQVSDNQESGLVLYGFR